MRQRFMALFWKPNILRVALKPRRTRQKITSNEKTFSHTEQQESQTQRAYSERLYVICQTSSEF